ncbi:DUF6019 family protein [uncultured Clostridium sp.]|uniref:DUF6019 family protein n=1 Tax=uncultured Clostridium sp. TaxID=59620 RepID=UPI00260091E0|nr:DUF6019 family protein [uncultured Clostridium sp.]
MKVELSTRTTVILLIAIYFIIRLGVKNGVREAFSFSNNSRKKDIKKFLDYLNGRI